MAAATTLVLIAHLLCVNVAAGGPLVCAWLEWRGGDLARRAGSYLGVLSLLTLMAGGVLGLLLGWLKWTAEYAALWTGPLSYKLHWGAAEVLFSLVLACLYCLLASGTGRTGRGLRIGRGAIALLSGTNLLYHFPPLFIVAGKLLAAGETAGPRIGGAEFRRLMLAGETPALSVHVALACLAMAGIALLGLALRQLRRDQPAEAATIAGWGGRIALAATLAQLPVGLWTLALLPAAAQARLMGSDMLGTGWFLAAMGAAFWLARELAAIALGEATRPAMIRSMVAMVVTISLMTAMQSSLS
ncbi:MAG: hypothetical protein SFU86_16240 [Pirellulaceae bacterium]|nr:hypothetical protein [Pirellulaceae bacterium]